MSVSKHRINQYTPARVRAFTCIFIIMISTCPKAQQFYADYCAPVLDKYRSDDNYIVGTADGVKYFDAQLAMLNEGEVFSPVVNCDNKVIGFVVEDCPEYLFADTSGASDEDSSNAADIFWYALQRFAENEQKTFISTYSGFRQVYVADAVNCVAD